MTTRQIMGVLAIAGCVMIFGAVVVSAEILPANMHDILTPGVWELTEDRWDGVTIFAPHVTLDCKNHTIGVVRGGAPTHHGIGVWVDGHAYDVTIRNCIIRDFERGLQLGFANQVRVQSNQIHDNSEYGIYLYAGVGTTLRLSGNRIGQNGPGYGLKGS